MNGAAQYFHFGLLLISLANLLVIVLMIVIFVLAVALRLPQEQHLSTIEAGTYSDEAHEGEMPVTEVPS